MIGLNRRRTMGNVTNAFPSGYTRLQYVDNQGAAYCDTGIPINGDMTFEANICLVSGGGALIIGAGGNPNQTRNSIGLMLSSGYFRTIWRIGSTTSTAYTFDEWYLLSLRTDGFYLNDSIMQSVTRTSFSGSNFRLGTYYLNTGAAQSPRRQYIGDSKVNDVDFIPARRESDVAVGFLRMSDEVFLTSESGTSFLAGPNY